MRISVTVSWLVDVGRLSMHFKSTNQCESLMGNFPVISAFWMKPITQKLTELIYRSRYLGIFSRAALFCFQISRAHIHTPEDGCVCEYMCIHMFIYAHVCICM